MRNQTRVGRLNRTADLLKTIKENRFIMQDWASKGAQCKPHLTCGAAACALGWEASQPRARRAGLRLVYSVKEDGANVKFAAKNGNTYTNFSAAVEYYGIRWEEAINIFRPDEYKEIDRTKETIKKSAVIKRLRSLAKQYKDNPV